MRGTVGILGVHAGEDVNITTMTAVGPTLPDAVPQPTVGRISVFTQLVRGRFLP